MSFALTMCTREHIFGGEPRICSFNGSSSHCVSICLDISVRIAIIGNDRHHLHAAHAHIDVALLFYLCTGQEDSPRASDRKTISDAKLDESWQLSNMSKGVLSQQIE